MDDHRPDEPSLEDVLAVVHVVKAGLGGVLDERGRSVFCHLVGDRYRHFFGDDLDFLDVTSQVLRFGKFEVVEELGAGAQGCVYRVVDRSGDEFALKALSASSLHNGSARARLEREARILARLDHPSVCRVVDAQLQGSHPFIVMEYIAGPPPSSITSKRDRADIGRVLSLMASVARGAHAAHRRGLIHRDIKTSNILVGSDDRAVLIDFGIGSWVGDHDITRTSEFLGTPAYCSPEQLDGDMRSLTPQSDVYSLGVTLFELIEGRLPFSGVTRADVERSIRRDSVPGLSHELPSDMRRELTAIIDTALQKDPARRYGTALSLAEDLERARSGQSVIARRTSAARRAYDWCERNRAASVAIASLLIGVVATSFFWNESEAQRKVATIAARDSEQAAVAEQSARVAAVAEADSTVSVLNFFVDVFTRADPWKGRRHDVTLASALEDAGKRVTDGGLDGNDNARAILTHRLGQSLTALGRFELGRSLLEESVVLHEVLYGENDQRLVPVLEQLYANFRAERLPERAIEVAHRLGGLTSLSDRQRLETASKVAVASVEAGLFEGIVEVHEQLVDRWSAAIGPDAADTWAARRNLAAAYRATGRVREAAELMQRVVDYHVTLHCSDHPSTLFAQAALAGDLVRAGDVAEGVALFERLSVVMPTVFGDSDPRVRSLHHKLGRAYIQGQRPAEALAVFEPLIEDLQLLAVDDAFIADVRTDYGDLLLRLGHFTEATASLRIAREAYLASGREGTANGLIARGNLGKALYLTGDHKEAVEHLEGVAPVLSKMLGPGNDIVSALNAPWAHSLSSLGRQEEASDVLSRAIEHAEEAGAGFQVLCQLQCTLAEVEVELGKRAAAEARRLALLEAMAGAPPTHPMVTMVKADLAHQYRTGERYDESEAIYTELDALDLNPYMAGAVRVNLAKIRWAQGDRAGALDFIDAFERTARADHPGQPHVVTLKAEILAVDEG